MSDVISKNLWGMCLTRYTEGKHIYLPRFSVNISSGKIYYMNAILNFPLPVWQNNDHTKVASSCLTPENKKMKCWNVFLLYS